MWKLIKKIPRQFCIDYAKEHCTKKDKPLEQEVKEYCECHNCKYDYNADECSFSIYKKVEE